MPHPTPRSDYFLVAILVTGIVAVASPLQAQPINEDLKFLASDGVAGDYFGYSVAIDNNIVAVGSRFDDDNGPNSGGAYLFDATTGVQIRKLVPTDGTSGNQFGNSIAIHNGVVAVGAFQDDDNGTWSGSAYLFNASTGVQIAKLLPTDGAGDDWFGSSIAIHNGVVAVGAFRDDDNGSNSGSAYLFDAATGDQLFKLLPADGAADQEFGNSISINDGVVAVGAHRDDDNDAWSGSAYLFSASNGLQIGKLVPADGEALEQFGESIAISDGIVAVGARFDDDNGPGAGSAYLFDASSGSLIAKLLPNDATNGSNFGISISIDNGVVAAGAFKDDDNGFWSGSAYLFDASNGSQVAKLLPSDGGQEDTFGYSIAINNGAIVVGAHLDNDQGGDSGSAYLFRTSTGIHLALTSSCPNSGPLQITWTNATPNGSAALLYARNTGSFVIPNNRPCSGTILGLGTNQLQVVFTGPSNSNGDRTLNASASAGACGGRLQLLDLTTCDTSNVATIQ